MIIKDDKEFLVYSIEQKYFAVCRNREDKVLPMTEILAHLNRNDYEYSRKFTEKDIPAITKEIENHPWSLKDYEVVDGNIQPIKYEPYKTIFETSGKIIMANDLRDYFNGDDADDFDVNQTRGIIDCTDFYAKQGMLHGFVGNSCPTVYLSEKHGEILIGVECVYDENGEWTDEADLPDDTYKEIGYICTDLWWYSIVDLENFKNKNPDIDTNDFEIAEIPKGKWELTHKYGISSRGYHEDLPYATLKFLGE